MRLRNLLMGWRRAGSVSLTLFTLASAPATGVEGASRESLAHAEMLRNRALEGTSAMAIVTSLTTEVGPRLAGSEAEARARAVNPEDATVFVVASAGASVERTTYVGSSGVRSS